MICEACQYADQISTRHPEAYSEPCQTSKMGQNAPF